MKEAYKDRYLLLLMIPGLLVILLFRYLPMGGIVIAFKDYDIFKGVWQSPWVGFKNFQDIFSSSVFFGVLRNTVLISLYKLIFGTPVPIIMALLLNEMKNKTFKSTIQTFIYFPHFISWVVISGIMLSLFSVSGGVIVEVFKLFGMQPVNILTKPEYFRSILVISDIWKESGWGTIIYLAAISQIDQNLYEAAIVDGAGRWRQMWNITLPCMSNVIVLLLILSVGSLMDAGFEQIQVLQNKLVMDISDIFDTYVYRIGIKRGEYTFPATIGFFKSVVAFLLIYTADRVSRLIGEEGILK